MLRYFITGLEQGKEKLTALSTLNVASSLTTTLGFNMPRLQKTLILYKP